MKRLSLALVTTILLCLSVAPLSAAIGGNAARTQSPLSFVGKRAESPVGNWYGYYMGQTVRSCIGMQSDCVYDVAAFFQPTDNVLQGKKIKAVRIWLRDLSYFDDEVKVWISTTLPASADDAQVCVTVDKATLTGGDHGENYGYANDIVLPEAYTFPQEGCYVGYTITVNNSGTTKDAAAFPIAVTATDAELNDALYMRASSNLPNWTNRSKTNRGNLALQVLAEGNVEEHSVVPSDFGEAITAINSIRPSSVEFINNGTNAVESLSYKLVAGETESEETTVELSQPVEFGANGTFDISVEGAETIGRQNATLQITKVNNQPNAAADNTAEGTIVTLSRIAPRGIAVEELTGTECGWCPRGWVGMEKMRQRFGNSFVGLAIHRFNTSDPMYPNDYPNIGLSSAPSCKINRGEKTDPYFGTATDICLDVEKALKVAPKVALDVAGTYDSEANNVEVTVQTEPLIDGQHYTIELALIADNLEGEESQWQQLNYYAYITADTEPEDLAPFCENGEYGTQKVYLTYNDVVISSSFKNGTNTVKQPDTFAAEQQIETRMTLSLPEKEMLRKAIDPNKVAVVALVVNADGTIENSAKHYLTYNPASISDSSVSIDAAEKERYSLDGRKLHTPQRGINVVKMSNGTVKKEIIH